MDRTKYACVRDCKLLQFEAASFQEAKFLAGLNPNEVDHGSIGKGLNIVVWEFGLFDPPSDHHVYFSCNKRLYAGNALFYQADEAGETIDLKSLEKILPLTFYRSVEAVESAIIAGDVNRPQIAIGDKVTWQWPQPRPKNLASL